MQEKKCRHCKNKTEHYKKINNLKIYLCSHGCEVNYVLKRFLYKNCTYEPNQGSLIFNI